VLPLAVLLQRAARRVLYGDRELPRRIVSELRRLDLRVTPEEALRETLTLLARRLRLSYAAIAVRQPGPADDLVVGVGESRGRPAVVELVAGGTDVGRLSLEVAPDRDPFGPGDERLLEDVGAQVGALVQAVLANEELQHVRERLVTAREEERRRLRRDLHDGLGPSLAVLAMRLEEAAELIPEQPGRAIELVESLSERAREEIAEIRRLVDGLRPPALDQLGLVSALRQQAGEQGDPSEPAARMTWTVEAGDLGELPAAVEVAAYRIVLEAVTNALRHSGAPTCRVLLRRDGTTLVVEVRDTGRGLAAERGGGVGLTSMRQRAEELGGSCTVSSSSEGTRVEARLPLDGVEGD
jgi:two-component system, NarL family, sensor kinase